MRGAIDHVVTADAVLYPINQANVTPKISAPVKRVLVNRGDHVRAGPVARRTRKRRSGRGRRREPSISTNRRRPRIKPLTGATVPEDQNQSAGRRASRAAGARRREESSTTIAWRCRREGALAQKLVDDAKVAMVQAQSQFDTAQRHLQALNQVSQREAIRGAEAQVNAAKAHYDSAAVQLSYAQIRSPISGVVADRSVYPGEMAASGSPIVSIVDISQVVARANVPVKEAASISVGRPARITGPDGDLAGKVTVVSPAVDPNTTTVEVWVQARESGREAEARRNRARLDHRRDHSEHHRRSRRGAAQFR